MTILLAQDHVIAYTYVYISICCNVVLYGSILYYIRLQGNMVLCLYTHNYMDGITCVYIQIIPYNHVYTGCRILPMLINLACFVNNVICRITQISQIRCSYSSLQVTFFLGSYFYLCDRPTLFLSYFFIIIVRHSDSKNSQMIYVTIFNNSDLILNRRF